MSEVSEELTKEIDEAVEEVTVVSEGSEGEVLVPETSKETPSASEENSTTAEEEDTSESDGKPEESDPSDEEEEETPSGSSAQDSDLRIDPGTEGLDSFSNEALSGAMSQGLTLAEAKSFKSEADLRDFINRLAYDRAMAGRREEEQQQQQAPVDPFADLPKLDPDSYDPEAIEMFDRLTGIVKGQYETISNLQQNQQNFQQQHQEAQNAANFTEVEGWFDKQVDDLGENFKEVLGEGSFSSLDSNGSQYQKRDEIANQMSILIAGHRSNNIAVPPREQVFASAMKMVLGDKVREIEKSQLSDKLKSQSKQHIRRANKSSSSAVKTPDEEDQELADLLDQKFSS